jgi:hypothetical protein
VETPCDERSCDSRADALRGSGYDGRLPGAVPGSLPRTGIREPAEWIRSPRLSRCGIRPCPLPVPHSFWEGRGDNFATATGWTRRGRRKCGTWLHSSFSSRKSGDDLLAGKCALRLGSCVTRRTSEQEPFQRGELYCFASQKRQEKGLVDRTARERRGETGEATLAECPPAGTNATQLARIEPDSALQLEKLPSPLKLVGRTLNTNGLD